jgi:hypothetical protein
MQAILDIVPIGIGVAVIPECRLMTHNLPERSHRRVTRKECLLRRSSLTSCPKTIGSIRTPRLREAVHKYYGMLSAFSTITGDQAASLEGPAARGRLNERVWMANHLPRGYKNSHFHFATDVLSFVPVAKSSLLPLWHDGCF